MQITNHQDFLEYYEQKSGIYHVKAYCSNCFFKGVISAKKGEKIITDSVFARKCPKCECNTFKKIG